MDLKSLTNPELIIMSKDFETREEVIGYLVKKLAKEGKISDERAFYKAVMDREALSPTGLEAGLAIPHGKSKVVKEASFAIAKLNKPIKEWESIDEKNKVDFVFLLAIPEKDSNTIHLDLLAELATRISKPEYRKSLLKSTSPKELYNNLDNYEEEKVSNKSFGKTILAVTACPAGIAHTYMAAEALERAGKELGLAVYVEKQGANGIEDAHTEEQLRKADGVIIASDVAVKNIERYNHLPIYKTTVASPIKDGRGVIKKALNSYKTQEKKEYEEKVNNIKTGNNNFKTEIKNSILTGISYIIPIIVAGGMILSFSVLVAQGFGLQELYETEGKWLWLFRQLGGTMLGTLMIPVLSAYMAYAIADKPALGPGFAGGVAANLIGSGFLGGMLGGLLAGYVVKLLKEKFPPKGNFAGFISFWVYPVIGSLIVGALMLLVIGKPVASINESLTNWLTNLSGTNAIILGAVIGIMVSFDLGGPVNKAAYAFCIGAMANGNYVPYAAFASVKMVSAFSVTAATNIFKKYYEEYEIKVGKSTWILGLAGITEGAIPFMIEDPLRVIPSLCIGSAVTGAMVMNSNIGLSVPGAGIFSLFVLEGTSIFKAGAIWLGAALIGTVVSTALLVITRKNKLRKRSIETYL